MLRIAAVLALLLAALVGTMVVRTLGVAPPPAAVAAAEALPALDTTAMALHLAGAVRFPTVSLASGAPIDTTAFLGLHAYLQSTFPLAHAALRRETINGLSLLYTWPGRDTTLAPLVVMGHLDVVPVTESNLGEWEHPPFSGELAGGFVWGRGTLDDKATVLAALEAVEALLTAPGSSSTRSSHAACARPW